MAKRGRPRKAEVADTVKTTARRRTPKIRCLRCQQEYEEGRFYSSKSILYPNGRIPYCKKCLEEIYELYRDKYELENMSYPEKMAYRRICMAFDIYYSDEHFDKAIEISKKELNGTLFGALMRTNRLYQNTKKCYDTTMKEEMNTALINQYVDTKSDQRTIDFFGAGFSDDDYTFLQKEYNDWTSRHECNTKAQEEIIKDICFNRLQNLKALRLGQDTKDITASFQKLLDSGKLQPKQNANETVSESQTFGTLIDKWENTRPIPDVDEELKDVDKIGLYLDIFFRGHLAKMMGMKNGLSNLYEKFISKYTVKKPEYDNDEDDETLFDAIFGNATLD